MKKFITAFLIFSFFFACSSEEPELELFSPEAYAFALDNGWELNSSVRVKNFKQIESDGKYYTAIAYHLDLITPQDTIKEADFGSIEETYNEEIMDLAIDSQIELDSSFTVGSYRVVFYVEDLNSQKRDTLFVNFELTVE